MSGSDQAMVLHAISFAARQHEGQLRKDGQTPYVAHPMRVLAIMTTVFGVKDPATLVAAVLHDTIEDTTTDRDDLIERFGERVASFVAALTKDKRRPEEEREKAYFETLAAAPVEVKLCKLADTFDNLIDSATLSDQSRTKTKRKAQDLVRLFTPGFPPEWHHVLETVEQQIDR